MRSKIIILFFLSPFVTAAQQVNIIPQPANVKMIGEDNKFSITSTTQILLEGSNLEKMAAYINDYLQKFYLLKLKVVKRSFGTNNVIRLNYQRMDNPIPGAYTLTIDNNGITIGGDNENGVFNALQTLIQLLPMPGEGQTMPAKKLDMPSVFVQDAPRFAYRGMHQVQYFSLAPDR
jgi:hexosaminidase